MKTDFLVGQYNFLTPLGADRPVVSKEPSCCGFLSWWHKFCFNLSYMFGLISLTQTRPNRGSLDPLRGIVYDFADLRGCKPLLYPWSNLEHPRRSRTHTSSMNCFGPSKAPVPREKFHYQSIIPFFLSCSFSLQITHEGLPRVL